MTIFFRVLDAAVDDKARMLRAAITSVNDADTTSDEPEGGVTFGRDPSSFRAVPGTPFAYWASDKVMALFSRLSPFASGENTVKQGLASGDDFRLMRLWWEPKLREADVTTPWTSVSKGGNSRPYYADLPLLIGYSRAHQVAIQQIGRFGRGATHYYLPGLTYTLRARRFRPQALPANVITTVRGSGIYAFPSAAPFLALLNSNTADYLLKLMLGRGGHPQFDMGDIAALPVPSMSDREISALATVARRAWSAQRSLDTTNETSHAFLLPPGLNERLTRLDRVEVERDLKAIQEQIDEAAFELYGIGPEDRAAIETSSKRGASAADEQQDADDEDGGDVADDDWLENERAHTQASWLVGVSFSRFDPRLATGERPIPLEPEPFDPLPLRSPGMYPEGEEPIDRPGILVDDEGHADDLAARVRALGDRIGAEVAEDVRAWLAKEFFPLHIKMYSKSRRKAPVYWQLGTPSASYSVWLYTQSLTNDTFFRVQNDYTTPKLAHEERRLESLATVVRVKATAAQRKELATQQNFVAELRAFLEEVERVAPLWSPKLDDGVIINFAPLWRLVPQHKFWQRELKSAWEALCDGKYDWAHLAMHLWPERVVPKCAKDRSLAIAHGLEDVFWVNGDDGKWTARKTPTRGADELVRELTSPAVKSALKSLLEAPADTGRAERGRTGHGPSTAAAERGEA